MHTPRVHIVARPVGEHAKRSGRRGHAIPKRWREHGRYSDMAFVLLAIAAFVVLLYLGRGLTFFGDEWTFITGRQALTLSNLLEPHNEHWTLFPILAYKALFSVVGLHSYLPYLVVLLALHLTAAGGLFVLLRRTAGPIVAVGGATIFLFLGSAYQDLFWAFQIGFVGSVASGLWAIVIVERSIEGRRFVAIAVLLFVSVASSGLGLFFLVAVSALGLFDPLRRRALWPVAIVTLVYLAWFGLFGRTGLNAAHTPFTLAAISSIPAGVITGGGRGI